MRMISTSTRAPVPIHVAATLGTAWNIVGVIQFWGQVSATPAMLIAKGMTASQATLYASLPGWMITAFAVGVFGGLAGTLLLLISRRAATTLLGISLLGYIALYIGDLTQGVFAAFGLEQVVVLTVVVAIAAALLFLSRYADRRGWLR